MRYVDWLTDWQTLKDRATKRLILSRSGALATQYKYWKEEEGTLKEIFFSARRSQNKESNPNQELEVVVASNAFFISILI